MDSACWVKFLLQSAPPLLSRMRAAVAVAVDFVVYWSSSLLLIVDPAVDDNVESPASGCEPGDSPILFPLNERRAHVKTPRKIKMVTRRFNNNWWFLTSPSQRVLGMIVIVTDRLAFAQQ